MGKAIDGAKIMTFAERLQASMSELEAQGDVDSPFKTMIKDLSRRMAATDDKLSRIKAELSDLAGED